MEQPNPPYVLRIVEQPADNEVRFRYAKEGRSRSDRHHASYEKNKLFPVLTTNYRGRVRIIAVLVDKNYKPHPHSLVGPSCTNGIYEFETIVTDEKRIIVLKQNVGIQCAKKPDVSKALKARRLHPYGDPFSRGYDPSTYDSIDLHEVRLAFIALIGDAGGDQLPTPPIASRVVRDSKASLKLNIIDTSDCRGPATGGSQLILLTDTVYEPSSIKVLFYEPGWQACAASMRIHKSVAFVTIVPPYCDTLLTEDIDVHFVLTRKPGCEKLGDRSYDPSDDHTSSNSFTFQYYPGPQGQAEALRLAKPPLDTSQLVDINYDLYNEALRDVESMNEQTLPTPFSPPNPHPLSNMNDLDSLLEINDDLSNLHDLCMTGLLEMTQHHLPNSAEPSSVTQHLLPLNQWSTEPPTTTLHHLPPNTYHPLSMGHPSSVEPSSTTLHQLPPNTHHPLSMGHPSSVEPSSTTLHQLPPNTHHPLSMGHPSSVEPSSTTLHQLPPNTHHPLSMGHPSSVEPSSTTLHQLPPNTHHPLSMGHPSSVEPSPTTLHHLPPNIHRPLSMGHPSSVEPSSTTLHYVPLNTHYPQSMDHRITTAPCSTTLHHFPPKTHHPLSMGHASSVEPSSTTLHQLPLNSWSSEPPTSTQHHFPPNTHHLLNMGYRNSAEPFSILQHHLPLNTHYPLNRHNSNLVQHLSPGTHQTSTYHHYSERDLPTIPELALPVSIVQSSHVDQPNFNNQEYSLIGQHLPK